MANKASVTPTIKAHFNTLRDAQTGKFRAKDFSLFLGVPGTFAIVIGCLGFRLKDASTFIGGLAVFTALLFGLVIFIFQLRLQLRSDRTDLDRPRVAELIDETFANVTYSVVVGIAATTIGVIASAIAGSDGAPVWISATLGGICLHLVLTILMCLKRVHSAYVQLTV